MADLEKIILVFQRKGYVWFKADHEVNRPTKQGQFIRSKLYFSQGLRFSESFNTGEKKNQNIFFWRDQYDWSHKSYSCRLAFLP